MALTPEQEKIREVLVDVAKRRSIINYGRLVKRAGLESKYDFSKNPHIAVELGYELGEISAYEYQNGRPMISSVVVSSETNMPGNGFYDLATGLTGKTFANRDAKEKFAMEELNKTHDYWATH